MESGVHAETSVDTSHVISLIRSFLHACHGDDAQTVEEHGSLLWDLSAGPAMACAMVEAGLILDVLETLLALCCMGDVAAAPGMRTAEMCMGILGNLAAVDTCAAAIAARPLLLDAIMAALHTQLHTPMLTELCRLGSVALRKPGNTAWLALWADAAACGRLLEIVDNTLDAVLHARALDLTVAILAAEERQVAEAEAGIQPPASPQAEGAGASPGSGEGAAPASQHQATRLDSVTSQLLHAGLLQTLLSVLQQWLKAHGVLGVAEATAAQPAHAGHTPAADTLGSVEWEEPQLEVSDEGLDAVLRCMEVLCASEVGRQGLVDEVDSTRAITAALVDVLRAEPGPAVAESLVVGLVDLDAALAEGRPGPSSSGGAGRTTLTSTAAPSVARALVSGPVAAERLHGLMDIMAELEQRHSHLREGVLYVLACGLRELQACPELAAAGTNTSALSYLGGRLIRLHEQAGEQLGEGGFKYVECAAAALAAVLNASGDTHTLAPIIQQLRSLRAQPATDAAGSTAH